MRKFQIMKFITKSQHLPISAFILLFSTSIIAENSSVDPDYHYKLAKQAYHQQDCISTIHYLEEYLKKATPSPYRMDSIERVMLWCHRYISSTKNSENLWNIYGIIAKKSNKSIQEVVNDGEQMSLREKPELDK
ncbi:hypothetical protein [Idiomarina xiamenensis]|uniref:Uncharacterized protein n=1 Tax=Idiomarina xiamenensis 10-D-4 TaxID=740709 RepID=K2KQP9_9GAMM|nr:hypothetical protein [Idiomarina xiamenensis]EKE84774.1 hypothetical protein A10D4_04150 [Idiomarina xiamenensis 10-D-4]